MTILITLRVKYDDVALFFDDISARWCDESEHAWVYDSAQFHFFQSDFGAVSTFVLEKNPLDDGIFW